MAMLLADSQKLLQKVNASKNKTKVAVVMGDDVEGSKSTERENVVCTKSLGMKVIAGCQERYGLR
jgi:hypothetical protein